MQTKTFMMEHTELKKQIKAPGKSKKKFPEAWRYNHIRHIYGDNDDNEDMLKLVLVCGNCGYKDCLVSFRKSIFDGLGGIYKKKQPWPSPDITIPDILHFYNVTSCVKTHLIKEVKE